MEMCYYIDAKQAEQLQANKQCQHSQISAFNLAHFHRPTGLWILPLDTLIGNTPLT